METQEYTIKKYKSALILSIISFMAVMLGNALPKDYVVYFVFAAVPVMLYFMFRHYQVIKQVKSQKEFMVFILVAVIIQLGLTFAFFT